MERKIQIFLSLALLIFATVMLLSNPAEGSSEWLVYDNYYPERSSPSFSYQGVRFSLSDGVVSAPLLTIRFYYSTSSLVCPVTVHITGHDYTKQLAEPITYNAVNGWNELDVSAFAISATHNFYIILESSVCGNPMLDDGTSYERSFKGRYLENLTSRCSSNLLIRAEVGEPILISEFNAFISSISEKIKVEIQGNGKQTFLNNYDETWNLYSEGSFEIDSKLYGLWDLKRSKYRFSFDPEDISEDIGGMLEDMSYGENSDIIVTKESCAGKKKKDGSMSGTCTFYIKVYFNDFEAPGSVIIEKKFKAVPAVFQ
jgi:hypothetical protein